MSETPNIPKGSGMLKKKVAGVPVIYLAAGFVVILAFLAFRMKPATDPAATDAGTDAANPSGSNAGGVTLDGVTPPVPSGTVVVSPQTPAPDAVPYEDNSTWRRKAIAFLIAHGKNPGAAELAMQAYLSGASLTYEQGIMRDMVIKEFGPPPDDFTVGPTAAPAPPVKIPVPVTPAIPIVKNKPPVVKPTPPKRQTYIVRHGDTLGGIAAKFHVKGGWQTLYSWNHGTIGSNPNLIKPGMRLYVS